MYLTIEEKYVIKRCSKIKGRKCLPEGPSRSG